MSDDAAPNGDEFPPVDPEFGVAVSGRDALKLRQLILASEFLLISIHADDEEDEEAMDALTADVDDQTALIAFTSEAHAQAFVDAVGDTFEEDDEIQGFMVEGVALLEYLPEDYGLLFNPESDDMHYVDVSLAQALAEE